MGHRPEFSALELWIYGHEVLDLVRVIASTLESGGDSDKQKEAILKLHELLSLEFDVPEAEEEPPSDELPF